MHPIPVALSMRTVLVVAGGGGGADTATSTESRTVVLPAVYDATT